jgi:poly-beta-1,6-N-acetyl-D-glucosamine synthase
MELLFWASVALIAYVYVGYPALLAVWAWLAGAPDVSAQGFGERRAEAWPGVSVVIAARNEARRLPARIENLLSSDYPQDRMQIIVASDGSTDGTIEALAPYASRVELIMLPPGGKARALNAAVSRARHPILVFADARQRFAPDAIRRLVRHFTRLSVGAVSGELVLDCEQSMRADLKVGPYADNAADADNAGAAGRAASSSVEADLLVGPRSTIGDGIGAYWKYEKWLRGHEAAVGSTLGVTGAVYAMRRGLWEPLPPDTILDDVLTPMRIVLRRYRVIVDRTALAFDEAAADAAAETRRKVRTLAGNFQLLGLEPRLLVPGVNPVWLQFMSHKIGRLVVPYALVALFVASAALATTWWGYATAFAAQAVFYGLAAYGACLDRAARVTPATSPNGANYAGVVKRHEAA